MATRSKQTEVVYSGTFWSIALVPLFPKGYGTQVTVNGHEGPVNNLAGETKAEAKKTAKALAAKYKAMEANQVKDPEPEPEAEEIEGGEVIEMEIGEIIESTNGGPLTEDDFSEPEADFEEIEPLAYVATEEQVKAAAAVDTRPVKPIKESRLELTVPVFLESGELAQVPLTVLTVGPQGHSGIKPVKYGYLYQEHLMEAAKVVAAHKLARPDLETVMVKKQGVFHLHAGAVEAPVIRCRKCKMVQLYGGPCESEGCDVVFE